jgi:hypothetical protein
MIRQHTILWTLAIGAAVVAVVTTQTMATVSRRVQHQDGQIAELQLALTAITRSQHRPQRQKDPDALLHAALEALYAQGGDRWLVTVAEQVVEIGGKDAVDQLHDAIDRVIEDEEEAVDPGPEILATRRGPPVALRDKISGSSGDFAEECVGCGAKPCSNSETARRSRK